MRDTLSVMFIAMIVSFFIGRPISSYADWNGNNSNNNNWHGNSSNGHGSNNSSHNNNSNWNGNHNNNWHNNSYVGVNLSVFPDNYYYGAPYYPPADEVLASSPDYEPVAINGTTYYLNNGTYYMYNGYEYQPVAPPQMAVQQPVTGQEPPETVDGQAGLPAAPTITSAGGAANDSPDSFTVNVPNNKGGYTAVTLKKSGNGFIGPQGEFYPEFPKVSQLEVMYGK